jgi:hypothetical protein
VPSEAEIAADRARAAEDARLRAVRARLEAERAARENAWLARLGRHRAADARRLAEMQEAAERARREQAGMRVRNPNICDLSRPGTACPR